MKNTNLFLAFETLEQLIHLEVSSEMAKEMCH